MDARNRSTRTLDLPTVGIYNVQPGQTVMGVAGQYAPLIRQELVLNLLHQTDVWEPADDEATEWLKDNPVPPDPELAAAKARRNQATTLSMRPEMVGLIPMPETDPADQPADVEIAANRVGDRGGNAPTRRAAGERRTAERTTDTAPEKE